jgi:pimeloyl-[acyl-carrier protein] methyl ester esterase
MDPVVPSLKNQGRNVATLALQHGGLLEFDDTGQGPAIVFLHGWSLGKEAFGIQRRELSGRFRIVVPDMRGHGRSPAYGPTDGIDTLARDLEQLLAHLDLDAVTLVGWSMGALVAWEFMRGPESGRVSGIVTIDMVPKVLNDENWQHGLRAGTHLYDVDIDLARMREDWPAFTRAYVPKVFAAGMADDRTEMIDKMTALVADNDVESMANLWTSLVGADYIDAACDTGVPTLITYGRLSQVYDEEAAAWMDEHVPNSRRIPFPDSGHAPHLEEPERFSEALADFIDELQR